MSSKEVKVSSTSKFAVLDVTSSKVVHAKIPEVKSPPYVVVGSTNSDDFIFPPPSPPRKKLSPPTVEGLI